MSEHNKARLWKLGKDVCIRKNNKNLFTVLVNLKGHEIEYYIYEYDVLSERVEKAYKNYINIEKRWQCPKRY